MWSCPSRLSAWPSQPMPVTCLTSNLIQLSTPRIPVPSKASKMRTGVIGIGKGLIILCMAGTWRGAMQQTHRHSSLAILCHRRRPFRSLCSSQHSSSASPIYGRLVPFCLTHPTHVNPTLVTLPTRDHMRTRACSIGGFVLRRGVCKFGMQAVSVAWTDRRRVSYPIDDWQAGASDEYQGPPG